MSGGAAALINTLELAPLAGSTGTIVVEDPASTLTAPVVYVGGSANAAAGTGRLDINGGTVTVNNLKLWGPGEVNINAGTLNIDGTLITVPDSDLNLTGGNLRLRASALQTAPHAFFWTGGTLHLVASGLTVGAGGLLGDQLQLNSRMRLEVEGPLTVANGASLISAGGAVLAAGGTNDGTISLIGGSLTHSQPVANNGNLDALRATLSFPGDGIKNNIGLTNNATLTLANAVVNGDVHSPTGSTIHVAAGVVFNGLVSGGANFPGAGTVTFNGGYSPGDSPAVVSFGGDLQFGAQANLEIEIGGSTAGSQFDRVQVADEMRLDGTLQVALIDGFSPSAGNSFDILDWGSLTGTFDSLLLPSLAAELSWDTSQLYTTGLLAVTSAGVLGDYNQNGAVDAADYVVWRKNDGTQAGYELWRANFGRTAGSGSGASTNAAVPESTTLIMLIAVLIGCSIANARQSHKLMRS